MPRFWRNELSEEWLKVARDLGDGEVEISPEDYNTLTSKPRGLGSLVERLVKPIAKALNLSCLDKDGQLKPGSPCARRRDLLNRLG